MTRIVSHARVSILGMETINSPIDISFQYFLSTAFGLDGFIDDKYLKYPLNLWSRVIFRFIQALLKKIMGYTSEKNELGRVYKDNLRNSSEGILEQKIESNHSQTSELVIYIELISEIQEISVNGQKNSQD